MLSDSTSGDLLTRPDADRAAAWIDSSLEHFVDELAAISEIPAPTFAESARALHVAERLTRLGVSDVEIDPAGNVVGCLGKASLARGPAFVAHLDTVFPAGTDVRVTRRGARLYGPGVGDNAAGIAGLLLAVEALVTYGLTLDRPLWIVASAGEEGLGDLCGIRAAMQSLAGRLGSVVAIEGALLGRVTHQAVGSLRWNVRFHGPGGHSWHDFGRPSAIDAAAAAVSALGGLPVAAEPRTTFNVGRMEGGLGVNVIAADASFLLDLRSTDSLALAELAKQAGRLISGAAAQKGVDVQIDPVGDRPAGSIGPDAPLVQAASRVLRELEIEPRHDPASTDANIPLSLGVPAITVGITHGGGVHTTDEWIDILPSLKGIRQLLLLALALCGRP